MKSLLSLLFLLLVSTVARQAMAQVAQPWLEDRRATRGSGLRSGNLEWHPGLAAEFGYDSNFFQAAGTPSEPVVPSLRLRVTPSLSLETLSGERVQEDAAAAAPPKVRFKAGSALSLDRLFALDEEHSDAANQTYVSGDINGLLNVSPDRPWGADFSAAYTRITQPYNAPGVVAFNRSIYAGTADLRWRPGGGLLEYNAGYGARLTRFEDASAGLDNLTHGLRVRGLWRFLPRTALLHLAEVSFVNRTTESRLLDANPVSSQLGVNGLITSRVGLLLMGGWKAIFFGADPAGNVEEFDGPIGRAELTWFINGGGRVDPTAADVGFSSLKLGYFRDGIVSELSNFYTIDKVYADLTAFIAGTMLLRLSGGFANIQHELPRSDSGAPLALPAPREVRPDAQLYAEYRLMRTLGVFFNGGFSASPRNNSVSSGPGSLDSLTFTRYTALMGVRWFL